MVFISTSWLVALSALLTVCAMAYSLLCVLAARNFLKAKKRERAVAPNQRFPPVSILKPLKGRDPNMYESFRSHCLQDYPNFEIIFGVNSANDEAAPLVEELIREFPGRRIKLQVCERVLGANGKVSSIVQMLEHAQHGYVIINDGDIRVPAGYLQEVMRQFDPASSEQAKVGLVTCFYRAVPSRSLWSKLEALGVSADFIPGALAARFLEGQVRFGLGSTLAVDRKALDSIGGMESLADYLADDYELANRMVQAGYRVAVPRVVVETFLPDYSFTEYLRHQLRWGRTVRSSRPAGYFGLLVTFGLLWALLTLIASGGARLGWTLLALVLLLRGVVLGISAKSILSDANALRNIWLLPLLDLIAPVVWLFSLVGNKILWRGDVFSLKKGRLQRL